MILVSENIFVYPLGSELITEWSVGLLRIS